MSAFWQEVGGWARAHSRTSLCLSTSSSDEAVSCIFLSDGIRHHYYALFTALSIVFLYTCNRPFILPRESGCEKHNIAYNSFGKKKLLKVSCMHQTALRIFEQQTHEIINFFCINHCGNFNSGCFLLGNLLWRDDGCKFCQTAVIFLLILCILVQKSQVSISFFGETESEQRQQERSCKWHSISVKPTMRKDVNKVLTL